MSRLRKDLIVIGCAVPLSLAKAIGELAEKEGFETKSDLLRSIVVEYVQSRVPAEALAEILSEIRLMEGNRL